MFEALALKFFAGLGASLVSIGISAGAFLVTQKFKPAALAFLGGQALTVGVVALDSEQHPWTLQGLLIFTLIASLIAFLVWTGIRASKEAARKKANSHPQEAPEESQSAAVPSSSEKWNEFDTAANYFPDLQPIYRELTAINGNLSDAFREKILRSQSFGNAWQTKEAMLDSYIVEILGQDKLMRAFAKRLIEGGHMLAFRELQEAVRVLGNSLDFVTVEKRIAHKHGLSTDGAYLVPKSKIDNIKRNMASLYKVRDQGYIAILKDGSAVGYDNNGYKSFSPVAEYRQTIRAFSDSHKEVLNPLFKERFVAAVQQLLVAVPEVESDALRT